LKRPNKKPTFNISLANGCVAASKTKGVTMMKTKKSFFACIVLVVLLAIGPSAVYASGSGTGLDDAPGNSIVQALKTFASGGWGKALFFCSMLAAIIGFLSHRHRVFGIIALVFGILLGVYGGLGESLWNLFTSWGSSGS
jgi:hypothetical protein